ncbi:Glutamate receptor [Thalictrum thalictroides]|uniref:Glutamate receptor n=1 Tax=Thalictrum thalictroides TaxID=46969 RepID=A0A7J6VGH3_THATH|nr:Glutamate receptor [Thalictrum thalictroides]
MFAPAKTTLFITFFLFISLIILPFHVITISAQDDITNIGAIINVDSRIGKEEKLSMELAVEIFNNASNNKHKIVLHVSDSGGDPLQAYTAAVDLINEKKAVALMGMDRWKEAALVTEAANRAQVPILTFAATASISPLSSRVWPFLIRMTNNDSLPMECVASIVGSYGWPRVIAIYEDDGYSAVPTHLFDELQAVGSEIEHWLVFPPFSTLSDPKTFIQEELEKLNSLHSRVFIFLRCSIELVIHISVEAKHLDFMGKDSVWITTDSVTSLLGIVNSSVISSMEGIIGIKSHFSETNPLLVSFFSTFRNHFQLNYPEEENSEPGIYAVHAYDTVYTLALAIEKSINNSSNTTSETLLLEHILSSSFKGLGGDIGFQNNELTGSIIYEIVNVDHWASCNTLKFWSREYGFSDNIINETSKVTNLSPGGRDGEPVQVLGGQVYWPGGLERIPLGWKVPSEAEPLIIGIPGNASFEKFVKVGNGEPSGYCIDVFLKAVELLSYDLPYKFVPFHGEYNALVDQVYIKYFGAAVGDITILKNRSNYVEFTQPYAESGLTMVVRVKQEDKKWLFVMPFTRNLWILLTFLFLYTMFVVWFLEHRSNPEFRGPWKYQLSTAMWFTFCTLFFAHRENLRNNFTRVVMFVWLFAVFVITSSYTASLTSMLTVQRLEPQFASVETLRRSNKNVGYPSNSFVRKYIEDVLHFNPSRIITVKSEYDYPDLFNNGTIEAAFLELPYERVLLARNARQGLIDSGIKHRFGGLGFVFPKGSPMARDFSKAFLKLSEDGILNELDEYWFPPNSQSSPESDESLSPKNFMSLFLVTGVTSTIILVLYIIDLFKTFRRVSRPIVGTNESFWNGIKRFGMYFYNSRLHQLHRVQIAAQERDADMFGADLFK